MEKRNFFLSNQVFGLLISRLVIISPPSIQNNIFNLMLNRRSDIIVNPQMSEMALTAALVPLVVMVLQASGEIGINTEKLDLEE